MSEPIEVDLEMESGTVNVGRAFIAAKRGVVTTNFTYALDYLALPGSYPIDPALPLSGGNHAVKGLPGAFDDASPDRWGRHIITKRLQAEARQFGRNAGTLTALDFLLGVSDRTRQGAVRFRVGNGQYLSDGTDVPKLVQLPELRQAAQDVESDPGNLSALKKLLDAGTGSLGGARPKASVQDGGRLAIAKFGHQGDHWAVIAWEAALLRMAEAAGISVPRHQLVPLGGTDSVLVLDRFDRDGERRIGYSSAMTMLELNDGAHGDYLDLLDVIDENSEEPKADRQELFRRIAFNIAVNNTDDHLRNHGFLRGRSGWRFSPAFDVNPNPDLAAERSTAVDGATTRDDAMAALLDSAEYFVQPSQRDTILASVRKALAAWRKAADACGIPRTELELFAPLFDNPPLRLGSQTE
ncbi:type II toxin-antitoxin system HipA family toxin [Pseudarthrobacter sp. AB1]|uniref:type II toxin-antitoxin system HipA family toxin n=1 Tax=Pseudarthrobacter sp. AB1 TaxID=2138309 RepID=UPI00186B798C|nr:type II toxin-antitoxin system HipA family toxin [Pseudarthrobacter sp. AB1]MBE4718044.1 phosphatidylinositol kinase [Pseudarthrobacter sp. AB1]